MNNFTRVFLVLLRLSIGWLFLFEGIEKVESHSPWSSAGYLQQSSGPLSPLFLWQAGGDADTKTLDRLTLVTTASSDAKPSERCPPALREDYEALIQRYNDYYKFSEDQIKTANEKLNKHIETVVIWLDGADQKNTGEKDVEGAAFGVPYKVKKTLRQRVQAYRDKVAEIRHDQDEGMVLFRRDVFKAKLRTAKADAARMRGELLADLEKPFREELDKLLTDAQAARPKLEPPPPPAMLFWTDRIVSYGLVVVGACLLLGLFTRLSCAAGALFVLMLYLALPAWPWLPENLKTEGHYLFVSKNLILTFALAALATTRSGRWFGLDGLVQFLNPLRYRRKAKADVLEKVHA